MQILPSFFAGTNRAGCKNKGTIISFRSATSNSNQKHGSSKQSICRTTKKVHDFRAHINVLDNLLQTHEYTAAEAYIVSVKEFQSERLLLVNTHHPILDALFNTKASFAESVGVEMDFEVNDLSKISLDAADMVVLLSI